MSESLRAEAAPERTALAWGRSAMSLVVVALLVLRLGFESGQPVLGTVVGGGLLVMAAVAWRCGRTAEDTRSETPGARAARLRTLAVVTAVGSLAAAVLALRS